MLFVMALPVAESFLVDTGVFIRWFVDQPGFEHAREIQQSYMEGSVDLETVDFARVEVAGVLRKKALLTGLYTREEFVTAVRVVDDLGLLIHETTGERLAKAADLAARHMLRMYDAVFVQMASELQLPLLTSDVKLCSAAKELVETELLRGVVNA
jgi:predicted nucleic acid-binding protein